MSKRARNKFERPPQNFFRTPAAKVLPLVPHLWRTGVRTFAEPCCGEGDLVEHLEGHGFQCVGSGDIRMGEELDARAWKHKDFNNADVSITNPPWDEPLMSQIMEHQSFYMPSWFLIYSDWLFTQQSSTLMHDRCTDIIPLGKVKWFAGTKSTGFENCCWVRMTANKTKDVTFWPMEGKRHESTDHQKHADTDHRPRGDAPALQVKAGVS